MTDPTLATPRCRLCILTRAGWRVLRLLLLPRMFALGGALAVLALMAPSSMPTLKRPPAKPAAAEAQVAPGAAPASASAATPAAPSSVAGQVLTTTTTVTTTVTTAGPVVASAPGASPSITVAAPGPLASAAAASAAASSSAGPVAGPRTATGSATGAATGTATAGAAAGSGERTSSTQPGPARIASASAGAQGASSPGLAAVAPTGPAGVVSPLRFRVVAALPSARVGARWGPHVVLEEGQPPYTLRFVGGKPAWMEDPIGGALAGTPRKPETVVFTLEGAAQNDPGRVLTQTYRVQVFAAAKQPPGPPSVPEVTREEAEAAARREAERDQAITWRLDAGDLKALTDKLLPVANEGEGVAAALRDMVQTLRAALADPPEPPRPTPAGKAPGPMLPTAKQLNEMLEPFLGVDYPTEAHFRKALQQAQCGYYQYQMSLIATARGVVGSAPCPGSLLRSQPGLAAGPAWPAYFDALMPAQHVEAIVSRARKAHPVDKTFDAGWTAIEGCGCAASQSEDEVHAFIPHWGTTEQQQASPPVAAASGQDAPVRRKPAPRQTDFSLFTRVSFFGAMLNDLGDAELPPHVHDAGQSLSLAAYRHGTRVDLVVYRSEWETLLPRLKRGQDLARFAERAAESTMKHVDARQTQYNLANALLLPFWRYQVHAYDGVTVFFDNLPDEKSPLAADFQAFHKAFVDALLTRMQQSGRDYGLNLVVPDHRVAERGLFEFKAMQDLILRAERGPKNKRLLKEVLGYKGKTNIRVNHIVLLSDPTTQTKKRLRELVDKSGDVTGARRVMVLDSMVPMLLRPMAIKSPWALDDPAQQFKDDLAYLSWTFGGAAVWEPPGRAEDDKQWKGAKSDKERLDMLNAQFRGEPSRLSGLCNLVCPARLGLRLALQSLVAVALVALALWVLNCAVRNLGLPYKIFLWALAGITLPLALAMLECDPNLEAVNEGHVPLMVMSAVLVVLGLYWSFRARRERP